MTLIDAEPGRAARAARRGHPRRDRAELGLATPPGRSPGPRTATSWARATTRTEAASRSCANLDIALASAGATRDDLIKADDLRRRRPPGRIVPLIMRPLHAGTRSCAREFELRQRPGPVRPGYLVEDRGRPPIAVARSPSRIASAAATSIAPPEPCGVRPYAAAPVPAGGNSPLILV